MKLSFDYHIFITAEIEILILPSSWPSSHLPEMLSRMLTLFILPKVVGVLGL